MKVLLVNGSPHKYGATNLALEEVAKSLKENNIETEIFWLGNKAISGCIGCGACLKSKKCFIDDKVNEFLDKAKEVDGFIFGTPVHYAGPSGFIKSFMDRVFYGKAAIFEYKPAASVVSCRRGGASTCFDYLNKYYTISNMIVIGSQYWNQIHGNNEDEAKKDLEGLQTMRTLGNNMAWVLKLIENGDKSGIKRPLKEEKISTNFIR